MVKAVLKNGVIQPLEPLPLDWTDGRELWVGDDRSPIRSGQDLEEWARELEAIVADLDPEDVAEFESALAAVRRKDREIARQKAGLP